MIIKINLFNVESLSYCPLQNTLTLNFKSGFRCNYKDIPEKMFSDFIQDFNDKDNQSQILKRYLKILKGYAVEVI